jgi:heme/copper-type cytochrome/quinol oxidase subunit 3
MAEADTSRKILELPSRRIFADHGVIGMALFVFTEVMLFSGFISAYLIVRNSAAPGFWPPPDQPRLPIERTALNSLALIASGVALYFSHRAFRARGPRAALALLSAAIVLGACFVSFQGAEWTALLSQGLTLTSSQVGAFFYLIVGAHALHAVVALLALIVCWFGMRSGRLKASAFSAVQLFWYFVVLVWPLLYWQVYL